MDRYYKILDFVNRLNQHHVFLWFGNTLLLLLLVPIYVPINWSHYEGIYGQFAIDGILSMSSWADVGLLSIYFGITHIFVGKLIVLFNRWGNRPWIRYKDLAEQIPGFICVSLKETKVVVDYCSLDIHDLIGFPRRLIGNELKHNLFSTSNLGKGYTYQNEVINNLLGALEGGTQVFDKSIKLLPKQLAWTPKNEQTVYLKLRYKPILDRTQFSEIKLRGMIIFIEDNTAKVLLQNQVNEALKVIEEQRKYNRRQRSSMEEILRRVENNISNFKSEFENQPDYLSKFSNIFSTLSQLGTEDSKLPELKFDNSAQILAQEAQEVNALQRAVISMIEIIEKQNSDLAKKITLIGQQNDELQRMDKIKDEFLANTSHELRTPLNGIIGITESMMDGAVGPLSEKQINNLALVVTCGRRLYTLINDLLDFSRMRENELQIHMAGVHLNAVVNVVLELSQHLIGGKPVQLINHVSDKLPLVLADERRLEQILYNLVGNAIKYTYEGTVSIEAEKNEDHVVVSVCDTGIGIPKKYQDDVFKPLRQIDGSITRGYYGTGLGLSITKQLVELHKSEIHLESVKGLGSRFYFDLPLADSNAPILSPDKNLNHKLLPVRNFQNFESSENRPNELLLESKPRSDTTDTILIVDDDEVNLQVLFNYLSLKNYHIVTAQDGMETLEMVESEQPDLILLDVMMPQMSGYEVCQTLRESYDLMDLPIIMMTARNQLKDLVQGFLSGANDYLVKPFFEEELFTRIETLLQAKASIARLRENTVLKEEIAKRQLIENQLESSQRRLARILDISEEFIICVDQGSTIFFANQWAEKLFEISNQAFIGKSVLSIFPNLNLSSLFQLATTEETNVVRIELNTSAPQAEKKENGGALHTVSISRFDTGEEPFYAIIGPSQSTSASSSMNNKEPLSILPSIEANHQSLSREKLNFIRSTLTGVKSYLDEGGMRLIAELRQIEAEMDGIDKRILTSKEDKLRTLIVQGMNQSLQAWQKFTQKSHLDLAEESKIWKASIDQGTWRTRTFDKYLKLETLPKRPRWRDVVRTIKFVVDTCPDDSLEKQELSRLLSQLKDNLKVKYKIR